MLLYGPKAGKSGAECSYSLIIQPGCVELTVLCGTCVIPSALRFNDLTESGRFHNPRSVVARFGMGRSIDSNRRARQFLVDQICALAGGPCFDPLVIYNQRWEETSTPL